MAGKARTAPAEKSKVDTSNIDEIKEVSFIAKEADAVKEEVVEVAEALKQEPVEPQEEVLSIMHHPEECGDCRIVYDCPACKSCIVMRQLKK